ncbi:hypothetical protein [Prevotella intermedia]|uniref:hypothetical protein n=1 Tax=Prevotella intermedia TaxID=28131 RepID=UPI0012B5BAE7|nr:hypothetical protein [Prevotella intermedia]
MGTSFISKHCEIQESALSASKLSSSISRKVAIGVSVHLAGSTGAVRAVSHS